MQHAAIRVNADRFQGRCKYTIKLQLRRECEKKNLKYKDTKQNIRTHRQNCSRRDEACAVCVCVFSNDQWAWLVTSNENITRCTSHRISAR